MSLTTKPMNGAKKRPTKLSVVKAAPTPGVAPTQSNRLAAAAERRAVMRGSMIAEAAYYLAERRGFAPGFELEDWLAAEAELARAPLAS